MENIRSKANAANVDAGNLIHEHPDNCEGNGDGLPRVACTADVLIDLARTRCTLWRDPSYRAFASTGPDNFPIHSALFSRWLTGMFYAATRGPVSREPLASAVDHLEAIAVHDKAAGCHETHVRVAYDGDVGYLDLADAQRNVIRFDARGWVLADSVPVKFVRSAGMLSLPMPVKGGHVDELRAILNIPDDSAWMLYCGMALAAFQRDGTRPIGAFSGENGSGKTFGARAIKLCTDPTKGGLRYPPKVVADMLIAAKNNRLVVMDNVSHLSDDFADTLCRLCTGGGLSRRTLYSNDDETIIDVCRPVILTSIPSLLGRDDVADRAIDLLFPSIPDDQRRAESELLAKLEQIRPIVLGSLLEAAGVGIAGARTVTLHAMPRLADFARFVEAAGVGAWGWELGHFTQALMNNRAQAAVGAVERSAMGPLIIRLLDSFCGEWKGTATELHTALYDLADDKIRRRKDWPDGPDAMGHRLRRLAPQLRKQGIHVDSYRENNAERDRIVTIGRTLSEM